MIALFAQLRVLGNLNVHQRQRLRGHLLGRLWGDAGGIANAAIDFPATLDDTRSERVNEIATPCVMNLLCRVVLFQSASFALAVG